MLEVRPVRPTKALLSCRFRRRQRFLLLCARHPPSSPGVQIMLAWSMFSVLMMISFTQYWRSGQLDPPRPYILPLPPPSTVPPPLCPSSTIVSRCADQVGVVHVQRLDDDLRVSLASLVLPSRRAHMDDTIVDLLLFVLMFPRHFDFLAVVEPSSCATIPVFLGNHSRRSHLRAPGF